ncbi:helix-turn-helix domain-containing protein [Botryobacter ruber]|uniref:helix-turn-helix domain-containing protein n=1 Tax=Botryobacter ruber TaxID=2171629 RepID=UPI000E0B9EA2|nr:helix-turn-helix domain-containing protein [Botryobacter ruber]
MNKIIVATDGQLSELIDLAFSNNLPRILEFIQNAKPDQANLPEILNVQQAAEVLDLAPSTIYGLVNKSRLPYFKKGHKLRFKRSQLLEWINSGEKKTQSQIEQSVKISTKRPSKL